MQHVIKKKKKRGLWPKLAIRHGQGKTPLEVYEIGKQTQRRLQIESERGR